MAGFMKMTKRLNSNVIGTVTGSDFRNGTLPYAYLGRAEDGKFLGIFQKYASDKLMIYGEKLDDFIFSRDDIAEGKVIGTNVSFKCLSNMYIGSKYEISFKNGKKAVICVPAAQACLIDNIIL